MESGRNESEAATSKGLYSLEVGEGLPRSWVLGAALAWWPVELWLLPPGTTRPSELPGQVLGLLWASAFVSLTCQGLGNQGCVVSGSS